MNIDDLLNPNPQITRSAIEVLSAVYDVLAGAGSDGVPAGSIYALLMAHGCTLEQYQGIEGMLVRTGLVSKRGDLLFANEPGMGK